jgi:hypothetical protein
VPDTPTLAKHHPYLLQGVLNFFMEQGKVALVASEDAATQAGFEAALEQQVQAQLGCDIIRLQARADEDMLATFNTLLAQISVQQATQASAARQANYLLWVSENEHFTPERFALLKNIILQFSGLQLKLLVSVTSDRWSGRLFDIAGRKIAYWFIPSAESVRPAASGVAAAPAAVAASAANAAAVPGATAAPLAAASAAATESSATKGHSTPPPAETADPINSKGSTAESNTSSNSGRSPSPPGRNLNVWVPAVGLVVLVGAAAFWLQDRAPTAPLPKPDTPAQAPMPAEAASAPEPEASLSAQPSPDASAAAPAEPAGTPLPQASAAAAQASASVSASANARTSAPSPASAVASDEKPAASPSAVKSPAATSAALPTPAPASPPQPAPAPPPQVTAINTLADCPKGADTDTLPTAKPVSYVKDTNYIFIKSKQSRKVCVAPAGGAYRLLNVPGTKGNSAYGNGPWRVHSPDMRQLELYFQGARVTLGPNVKDTVRVIAR